MKCAECVNACAEGELCALRDQTDEHKLTAHAMALVGGFWRCEKDHKVEAEPADAMRAAGQVPML